MADAAGSSTPFPLAKLCALLAVVGMTALPFVSCGMIDFKGHELLRNKPPEMTSMDLSKTLDLPGSEGASAPKPVVTEKEKRESLFTGGDAWLHWVYIAAFALAVAAVFVPGHSRFLAVLGIGGIAAVAAFVIGFDSMLGREAEKGMKVSVKMEIGAYATLAAFAGLSVIGIRARGRGDPG